MSKGAFYFYSCATNDVFMVRVSFILSQLAGSRNTVHNHVSNIFNKLEVTGRSEAIVRARKAGLGQT